jgi:acetyltransferase-like isoleucine patch superfamily enzyme
MDKKNLSTSYRFIKKLGFSISEQEYGNVSFPFVIKKIWRVYRNGLIINYCMHSAILGQLNYRKIRPFLWRVMGAKVGKDVYIGSEVWADIGNTYLISIEDGVHIANRCFLLCHQRDFSNYFIGDKYSNLPYTRKPIILKAGCLLGSGVKILPGVTIGEGSIIGAGSVVTRDIPSWSVAIGSPAKVVKKIKHKHQLCFQKN